MTASTWMHRLDEWSHPKPASTMAVVALALVAMSLVLLALGGVALSQDPEAFDLWVLAIGLFLLAGALVGIGRSPDRNPRGERARSFSDHASLAEAPAMSSTPPEPFLSRRPAPTARSWTASDTIAGQYAEAARIRSGRTAARRIPGTEGEGSNDVAYPYTPPSPPRAGWDASGAPRRTTFELEMDQLRARVADLEAARYGPAGSPAYPAGAGLSGPSRCVGCRTVLVGGPDDARCSSCGRPLCAHCYAAVPSGPLAHQCPECRGAPPPPPGAEGPQDTRTSSFSGARPREPIAAPTRPSWLESP
jgi:hypothetical protein